MIAPLKSLPTFLKEPIEAIVLLLDLFRAASTAASMAIYRPRTIGDAPERATAQRRTPSGRLSWLARNGLQPRGRKSPRRRCGSDDRGTAGPRLDQAIKRPGASALNSRVTEKTWPSIVADKN